MSIEKKSRSTYDGRSIQVLTGIESVRKRPGMYMGNCNTAEALWSCLEIVVQQCLDLNARRVEVRLLEDRRAVVRALRGGVEEGLGSWLQTVPRRLGTSANTLWEVVTDIRFEIAWVTALSSRAQLTSIAGDTVERCELREGELVDDAINSRGSEGAVFELDFTLDPNIFSKPEAIFDLELVSERIHELAAFFPEVLFVLEHSRSGLLLELRSPNGIVSLAERVAISLERESRDVFVFETTYAHEPLGRSVHSWWPKRFYREVQLRVVMLPVRSGGQLTSYVNGVRTFDGTHHDAFRGALGHALGAGSASDVRAVLGGFVSIVVFNHPNPSYRGCTKSELATELDPSAVAALSSAQALYFRANCQ